MCPKEQAKAWALREAWRELHGESTYGMCKWIVARVNNDVHTLGESKTGMYSYEVWLFRVLIVVAVDMSADWDPAEPWIKENCFDVLLQGPSWTE